MAKCPVCDGRGKYANAFGVVGPCNYCKGSGCLVESGRKNMTEQEWLQTCTTEQLAELLLRFYYQDFCMNTKRSVIEWLKQPHKGVEK